MTHPYQKVGAKLKTVQRIVAVILAGLWCGCLAVWAQVIVPLPPSRPPMLPRVIGDPRVTRIKKTRGPANSVLSGRVFYDDTQQPVSRAQVKLECNEDYALNRTVATDRNGGFVVSDVGACEFEVSAEAPGTLSRQLVAAFTPLPPDADTAKTQEETPPKTLTVALNGTNAREITIAVARGGAISGRVLYADGEPVTLARLTLFRQTKQGLMPFATSQVRTDDRGGYRIEEVPPGEYAVGVVDTISTELGRGVVTAYHPSGTDAQNASLVTVTSGGEAENINLQVPVTGLRRAGGIVKWKRTGEPLIYATLILRRRDERHLTRTATEVRESLIAKTGAIPELSRLASVSAERNNEENNSFPAKTDEEGRWSATDLPPGEYHIEITAQLPREPSPESPPSSGSHDQFDTMSGYSYNHIRQTQDLSLRDSNAEDITIELTEGSTLSGIMLDANGGPPSNPVNVMALAKMEDGATHTVSTVTRRDGTFQLRGLPASQVRLLIQFMAGNEGPRYVRSIMLGGVELANQSLTVTANSEISGLQVRLGNDFATLQGRVRTHDGQPAAGVEVVVVPADRNSNFSQGSFARTATDANGNFTAKIRPGEYSVVAAPDLPRNLNGSRFDAPRVTVTAGQPATVELTLQPPAKPKP